MFTKTPRDPDGTFKSWNTVTDEAKLSGLVSGKSAGLLSGVLAAFGAIAFVFSIFKIFDYFLGSDDKNKPTKE